MRASNALGRLVSGLTLLGAAGCASHSGTERLADGRLRVECDGPLSACLVPASQACSDHGYDVVSAKELHDMEGGSPYSGEFIKSQAIVRCRQAVPLFGRDPNPPLPAVAASGAPAAAPVASAAAPPPLSTAPRCVPGVSQACATTAGCTGAQVCARDGASFGACECAAPAPSSAPSDAGAP